MNGRSLAGFATVIAVIAVPFAGSYYAFRAVGVRPTAPVPTVMPTTAPVVEEPVAAPAPPAVVGLNVLWRMKTGAPVWTAPVACEQRVICATARGEIIAADFSGQRLWSRELVTGEQQQTGPVRERIEGALACARGLVLAGTMRGMLYALDAASGEEKWRVEIDGPIMGPAVVLGERVYVINRADGSLNCINANDGKILWTSEATDRCDGAAAITEGAAVFGSCAAALHVFSPETGERLRNIDIDPDSQVAAGVALEGDWAVVGCRGGKVVQANFRTGEIAWVNTDSKGDIFAAPVLAAGLAIVASNEGLVYAVERATGKQRWQFDTKLTPWAPVLWGENVVVSAEGDLFLIASATGEKLWSMKISDEITAPAVAQDIVFVASDDGSLTALGAVAAGEGDVTP